MSSFWITAQFASIDTRVLMEQAPEEKRDRMWAHPIPPGQRRRHVGNDRRQIFISLQCVVLLLIVVEVVRREPTLDGVRHALQEGCDRAQA